MRLNNWLFKDSILEFISVTRVARSILSDDGTQSEHRYLGHLLRWSEPRWIYQRRRDSRKISLNPAELVPRLQPCLSPFTVTGKKNEIKRAECGSQRLRVKQSVSDSRQISSRTAVVTAPIITDTPPSKILHIDRWLYICISNKGASSIK